MNPHINPHELFTEEQMDYLIEMLNIGAGNVTTALNQQLQCDVQMKLPKVEVVLASQAIRILGDPSAPVACLRMKMTGDLEGDLYFIVADDQLKKLTELAEQAVPGFKKVSQDNDHVLGVLGEIGNILAGVYLTALHDFCKLNLCHSIPVPAVDMMQALLDESLATLVHEQQTIILVNNEFIISNDRVHTFFLILPMPGATQVLVNSMKAAGKMYGYQQD